MWQCICFSTRLMLAGLGKTKLSRRKRIKVNYFPGGKTEDLQYYLIAYVDKKPDNISSSILVPTVLHNKLKTLYTNNWWMSSTAWKVSKYGVFSCPCFPAFGLNTKRYSVTFCIQSECGKIRTRKNSIFGHFSHREGNHKCTSPELRKHGHIITYCTNR